MNSKMTTNSQLSTTTPKKKKKNELSEQLEQEKVQRNRSHGRLSVGKWKREVRGKGTENKKYKW